MTCPHCQTLFVFVIPPGASPPVGPVCPRCAAAMSFEEAKASVIGGDQQAVLDVLDRALLEVLHKAALARPTRRALPQTVEWGITEGKPTLIVQPETDELPPLAIRIPDSAAFRSFLLSLTDAGVACFPDIAADDAFVNADDPGPGRRS